MGKHQEALPLSNLAHKGMEEELGAKHPETLLTLNSLGILLCTRGLESRTC